jgi:hypothetical protein
MKDIAAKQLATKQLAAKQLSVLKNLIRRLDTYSLFKHICVAKRVSMTEELGRILTAYCKEELKKI